MQKNDIFAAYKPLRNTLRQLPLFDSLYVIWAYANHLQFGCNFPQDIDVHHSYKYQKDYFAKSSLINLWDLELLAHEALVCCAEQRVTSVHSLRNWQTMAKAINSLKRIDGAIAERHLGKNNRFAAIERSMYRQFFWNDAGSPRSFIKYYKIYGDPPLSDLVRKKYGFDIVQIIAVILAIKGYFMTYFSIPNPPVSTLRGLSANALSKFLRVIYQPPEAYQKRFGTPDRFDENYMYCGTMLRQFPLVDLVEPASGGRRLACPLVNRFYQRCTEGIYYDIVGEPGFDNAFGAAFQSYVGEVLQRGYSRGRPLPEEEYPSGKGHKRTVDWIVDDDGAALFIECKTKRLRLEGTIKLSPEFQDADVGALAGAVCQVYKSITDCLDGRYVNFRVHGNKAIYPVIVTLTDWLFPPDLLTRVHEKVRAGFARDKIAMAMLDKYPYSLTSVDDLERSIQTVNEIGVHNYMMHGIERGSNCGIDMGRIGERHFPELSQRARGLFGEELDLIMSQATAAAKGERTS